MAKHRSWFSRDDASLTKSAAWLTVAKTLAFGCSFALPVLLVRQLSLAEFGLYKQVFLVTNTAVAVLPLGFAMTAFYFFPREPARQGQVILNIVLFHALVGCGALLTLVFRPTLLEAIFNARDLVEYTPLIGGVVFLWIGSSIIETVAVANGETKLAAAFVVAAQLARAGLLLTAAIFFTSLRALIYAAGVHGVLQSVMLLLYLNSRFPKFWQRYDTSLFRAQFAYALPVGVAALLHTLQMDLHNYVVSNRFGAATYAIYAIGCLQLPLVGILSESVNSVMIARVSHLRKRNEAREIVLLTARMMAKLAAVLLPAYVFLLIFGREFITLLFTEQYLASWPIFAINLTMIPLGILGSAHDPVFRTYPEHLPFLLRLRIGLFVVLLGGLWLATEHFRLVGAISVVVGVKGIEYLILGWKAGRIVGASWGDIRLLKGVGGFGVASAIAGGIAAMARPVSAGGHPLAILVIGAIVFTLVYGGSVFLLGGSRRKEQRVAGQGMEPGGVLGVGKDRVMIRRG